MTCSYRMDYAMHVNTAGIRTLHDQAQRTGACTAHIWLDVAQCCNTVFSGDVQAEDGGGWPATDAYLERRRMLSPGSPAATLHTINEAAQVRAPRVHLQPMQQQLSFVGQLHSVAAVCFLQVKV